MFLKGPLYVPALNVGSRKVAGSIPDEVIGFFSWRNPSRTMALGSTQPLTEMSTRNVLGGKGRPARKADDLTVICEPIVVWEPRRLTALWASSACYRDRFTFVSSDLSGQQNTQLLLTNLFVTFKYHFVTIHSSIC
jgi:hypothetical protein